MKYKQYFDSFIKTLDARLEQGYKEYGDASFDRPPDELLNELEEEIYDIFGWGFIMLIKLQGMKEKIKCLKEKSSST